MSRPGQNNEFEQGNQTLDLLPSVQTGKLIRPDNPVKLIIWKLRAKVPYRIDGVTGAASLQFMV